MDHKEEDNIYKKKVEIYHCCLNIKSEYHTTVLLITEVENGEVKRTYFYTIPTNYLDDSLLGDLHEKYCLYCPN